MPRCHVVCAGGLVGGVEIVEAEAHHAEPDLDGEAAGGCAWTPQYPQVSRRRGGMVARQRRGEKERGESGGEAQSGERAVARHRAGRERWQGTERWEGVGFYKARQMPRAKTSARPAAFSRAAQSFPDVSAISTLFSTVIFILYLIFISTSLLF